MTLQDDTNGLYEAIDKAYDLSLYWDHPEFHYPGEFSDDIRMWFAAVALELPCSLTGTACGCPLRIRQDRRTSIQPCRRGNHLSFQLAGAGPLENSGGIKRCFPSDDSGRSAPSGSVGPVNQGKDPLRGQRLIFQVEKRVPLKVALLHLTYRGMLKEIRSQSE